MLHSLMILPLMLAAFPTNAVRPADELRARCPKPAIAADKAVFKRLADLPPAEAFRAVYRSSDCPVHAIQARDRLGTFPKPLR